MRRDERAMVAGLSGASLPRSEEALDLALALGEHADGTVRGAALAALPWRVDVDAERVGRRLLRGLEDADAGVRNEAAQALSGDELVGRADLEPALLRRLWLEADEITRCSLCEALEWHGGPRAAPALLQAASRDGWLVRAWAVEAVGWVGCDEDGRAALRAWARDPDDARFAKSAAMALVLLGERSFAARASEAALRDQDAAIGLLQSLRALAWRRPHEARRLRQGFPGFFRRVGEAFPALASEATELRDTLHGGEFVA
ncbi:MAG: HEAT repeat domain-containing protein [Myxococcota bacterium]